MTRILIRAPKSPFVPISPEKMDGRLMGGNSGNLVFLDAAWKLLDTKENDLTPDGFAPYELGPDRINAEYDVYVIPMANAFRTSFLGSLARYTKVIEGLKIPVVMLSGGFQGLFPYMSGVPRDVDAGASRFLRAVLDRSGHIGVRGEYTQDYIKALGFDDVQVIGCPSMFLHGDRLEVTRRRPALDRDSRIAVNMTARVTPMGPVIEHNLGRYPKLEYIAQDKEGLRLMLYGTGHKTLPDPNLLPIHPSHPLIRDDRTRFYVDPWPWLDDMRDFDFVFGTRIHGNITALLAGTPAYVVAHDTRTLELSRYHEIPHRTVDELRPDLDAAELYEEADFGPFVAGHAARFRTYLDYVESHGLRHVFQPGEDPDAFERRIATVTFPPAVRVRKQTWLARKRRRASRRIRGLMDRAKIQRTRSAESRRRTA